VGKASGITVGCIECRMVYVRCARCLVLCYGVDREQCKYSKVTLTYM
jgi:hypothetical protein